MELIAGVLLTGSLILTQPNPQGREAAQYSALATYKQNRLDLIVEPKLKEIEKEYVRRYIGNLGSTVGITYRLLKDKNVSYSWSF